MSQTIKILNIRDFMVRHLADVFETMLSFKAVTAAGRGLPPDTERVSGSVGFAGESLSGAVYLHLSSAFAQRAALAMLGLPPEEIAGEAEVNDVVGEVTNMLTGGLKSWLGDEGAPCAISTPAIIRGKAFAIEAMPDVEREQLVFDCAGERVVVEIHVKFN